MKKILKYDLTASELELIQKRRKAAEIKANRQKIPEKYPVQKLQKDPNALHHYVKGIRILNPSEYEALREASQATGTRSCLMSANH